MCQFKYDALKSVTSEIRLVRVEPGAVGDHINLELFHANLDDQPKYRALSYTWDAPYVDLPPEWNDPESESPVVVNGKKFSVRKNLESALRHFQQNWKGDLVLWIDAICINQGDSQERSSAVLKMGKIYETSQETVVWLGPDHHPASAGFSKINALSENWKKQRLDCRKRPLAPENIAEYRKVLLEDLKEKDSVDQIKAIAWVMNCAWWRRVWVVQEVAVASSTMFICGNNEVPLSNLVEAAQQVGQHFLYMCNVQVFEEGSTEDCIIRQVFYVTRVVVELWALVSTYKRKGTSSLGLLDVLPALRSRFCSDARDKVYAALGVAEDGNIISPDYDQSLSQTYVDACRKVISKYQNLNILGYCELPSSQPSLPSWCPDWNWPIPTPYFHQPLFKRSLGVVASISDHVYNACNNFPLAVDFEEDSKTLRVQGILVGFVDFKPELIKGGSILQKDVGMLEWEKVLEGVPFPTNKVTECGWLYDWFIWLGERKTTCTNPPNTTSSLSTMMPRGKSWSFSPEANVEQFNQILYTPTLRRSAETFRSAYLRTLRADICLDMGVRYRGRFRGVKNRYVATTEADGWRYAVGLTLSGRSFIAGEEGFMGVGPLGAEIGDSIYIIMGSEVPFILRVRDNGTFTLVGECYIHGIMDGEILTSGIPYKVDTIRIV